VIISFVKNPKLCLVDSFRFSKSRWREYRQIRICLRCE